MGGGSYFRGVPTVSLFGSGDENEMSSFQLFPSLSDRV